MQLGDKRVSNNAESRRDFGMIMGVLGIVGATITVLAYVLGIAPGDILNITAQVGAHR